jgi:hypothetical protein
MYQSQLQYLPLAPPFFLILAAQVVVSVPRRCKSRANARIEARRPISSRGLMVTSPRLPITMTRPLLAKSFVSWERFTSASISKMMPELLKRTSTVSAAWAFTPGSLQVSKAALCVPLLARNCHSPRQRARTRRSSSPDRRVRSCSSHRRPSSRRVMAHKSRNH